MVEALKPYVPIINMVLNAGMLAVWIIYAQVLINSYRRQRRPKILISQGMGAGLESDCLISNMSSEAIHVESIIGVLGTTSGTIRVPLARYRETRTDEEKQPQLTPSGTLQGPLAAGSYVNLGSFQNLMIQVTRTAGLTGGEDISSQVHRFLWIELIVICIYGSENQPVGGRRRFVLKEEEGQLAARPETVNTISLRKRRERRELRKMLEERL